MSAHLGQGLAKGLLVKSLSLGAVHEAGLATVALLLDGQVVTAVVVDELAVVL